MFGSKRPRNCSLPREEIHHAILLFNRVHLENLRRWQSKEWTTLEKRLGYSVVKPTMAQFGAVKRVSKHPITAHHPPKNIKKLISRWERFGGAS